MGYWISPSGDIKKNSDHYQYVKSHPQLFGFTKKEVSTWDDDIRDHVLLEAKKRGWMRVRGTRPNLSIELWSLDNDAIFNLKEFFININIDPEEHVLIEEDSVGGKHWYEPASWILDEAALAVARNPRRRR